MTNHLILILVLSIIFNLLCLMHGDIENSKPNQISMIALDIDTLDCADEDSELQKMPACAYGVSALSFALVKHLDIPTSFFLQGHPVRAPPRTLFIV